MKIKKRFLALLFKISDYPILFRDLLEANALFNEGMLVDTAKLNYKIKTLNAYLLYAAFCSLILLPLLLITHSSFTLIDFHLSIISAVLVTACVFIGFDIFRAYARKLMTKRLIQRAWVLHFPHFPYEKYSKILAEIYKEAIKKEIPRNALKNYVLEQIITHSK